MLPGINTAFTAAAGLVGFRNDPYRAFNFMVEFEGLLIGGFSEVSGLQIEVEVEDYREGGQNDYVHRIVGPTRHPANLVLRHGLTDLDGLWRWHADGRSSGAKRVNGTIYLLDAMRIPAVWWDIREAYPVKWTGPDLNARSNEVALETLELVHRGISKPALSSAMSIARGVLGGAAAVAGAAGVGGVGL